LQFQSWALPALLLVPLLGALLIRLLGRTALPGREPGFARWRDVRMLAVGTLAVEAFIALAMWAVFDPSQKDYQFRVDWPWISDWGARITLGVDGFSLVMIVLSSILVPLAIIGSWTSIDQKVRSYYALLLVLVSGMMGIFVSLDLLLFYVMWEVLLVPLYFIIGIWGGQKRIRASLKFFLFTFIGSLLMLVAIVVAWVQAGSTTFSMERLPALMEASGASTSMWLFAAFFLAFAIKSALFPFHTWFPDAQHEAPVAGAVALGVKVGTYGMIRVALPLFPDVATEPMVRTVILTLAIITIIYGALVAMVQDDLKKLASYSSVSHLGFVLLGIFALTTQSIQGAVMVMINTGISASALFLLIGMLQDRRRTGMIHNFGGIARVMPMFAALLTLVALSTLGLPGTNGFVGEFLVLIGAYQRYPFATILAATGVILTAAYLLWALERVLYNPLVNPDNRKLRDLNRRELSVMGVFAILIIWLGVLKRLEGPSERLVQAMGQEIRTTPVPRETTVVPR
jgi:NADH-quinone oxidoreductase subunit M